jgi:hypothetical protein
LRLTAPAEVGPKPPVSTNPPAFAALAPNAEMDQCGRQRAYLPSTDLIVLKYRVSSSPFRFGFQ